MAKYKWDTEHGIQYKNNYNRNNYDRYSTMFPKGKKAEYMALADKLGIKLNTLINQLLEDKLNQVENIEIETE